MMQNCPKHSECADACYCKCAGRWQLPAKNFNELSDSMKATARLLFALHLAFDEVCASVLCFVCLLFVVILLCSVIALQRICCGTKLFPAQT